MFVNKKFWATIKAFLPNEIKPSENIVLRENGKLLKDEEKVANMFNNVFLYIVPNLGWRVNSTWIR